MTDRHEGPERRLILRVLSYWRGLSRDGCFPSPGSIDPSAMGDLWPHCFLLDLGADGGHPTFQRVGDAFAARSSGRLIGAALPHLEKESLADHATFFVDEVLRKRVAVSRGGAFADASGATVFYRSILLPLSDGGTGIDALLGAANCRRVVVREALVTHQGDAALEQYAIRSNHIGSI